MGIWSPSQRLAINGRTTASSSATIFGIGCSSQRNLPGDTRVSARNACSFLGEC